MKKILLLFWLVLACFATHSDDVAMTKEKIQNLNAIINANAWNIVYENFTRYKNINDELVLLQLQLNKLSDVHEQEELKRKIATLEEQLRLLKEYKDLNFAHNFSFPKNIESFTKLTNPLAIIGAFSYIKKITNEKEAYALKINEFKSFVKAVAEKNAALKKLMDLIPNSENLANLQDSNKKLEEFNTALQFAVVSYAVYEKKIDEEIDRVNAEIKVQSLRALNIVLAIAIVIAIAFMLKFIAKKYIKDNERYYTAAKIIHFVNINIIFLILLFAYIENITYLVTILGFASAGLAIAMKDMFMSMLGWCVIVFGGSFKVGDRVKVFQNETAYIGDIIDISFLRITIYEDITLETYTKNRRSGRIIFIPNNYVFTSLISNYTHHGMKTIIDGIDITITFDSNIDKAQELIEQIVVKYSKGYTDLARKTIMRLQNEYSIKNSKVEPRFFVFFEHWGMRISAWYMTNSYAALALRSTISKEIIKELNKHSDIKIAYPSQNLYFRNLKNCDEKIFKG
ncbi:mechanosensitive ion channel [Campylobacter sp. MIT 21-1685]|uniref:mechanosensitive ion channel domain-containing protein n=1 Tax=unclassified Campylobacter TaxID=2593542 RepID=UPI00224B55EB|nr:MULTISPECIES: mechanosensitive ion channel domain-containing protein [unclassified Campylobacter]MCX2682937.1 mechanosensitive ion channel [Campylobacter sp. MIT 21-1684]MCX2751219.1 mechanosensitive ion channel [Campylobacter sp. MIT 21-1682]MCX2807418.1 mechanosensitive ion channel [Campylobacter sp. MIT 21-1685]